MKKKKKKKLLSFVGYRVVSNRTKKDQFFFKNDLKI